MPPPTKPFSTMTTAEKTLAAAKTPAEVAEAYQLLREHPAVMLQHKRTAQEIESSQRMHMALDDLQIRRSERIDCERRSRPERRREA